MLWNSLPIKSRKNSFWCVVVTLALTSSFFLYDPFPLVVKGVIVGKLPLYGSIRRGSYADDCFSDKTNCRVFQFIQTHYCTRQEPQDLEGR
ncbi:hypothetical protein EUGRSUZ_I00760 [Eucalyptus grandis]|uniref:Uncharacterized protein n=2 Tax=Eucalyptus grandis TaxID=71139 RepID=A0ACC3JD49_EUCGR|nr:hypothetical protein EUGRSUZ_I00760 [Eucalyptus grandis]